MFSHEFYNICGVAMDRRFACHMQNLSYIIEIYCVGYAKFLLYSRGNTMA